MARMSKERVEQLMELHAINSDELIGGMEITDADFDSWLKGERELTHDQEQTIFKRALDIDLQERQAVWDGMKEIDPPINSLIKGTNIYDGLLRMWLSGERDMPYEDEKKVYEKYDKLRKAFESI